MGNCWAQCFGVFRREANRIQRGGGSKYFKSSTAGEHFTIEFENLVESDEGESSQSGPRPINEEEIGHLKEHCYTAISDKQALIDEKLMAELVAEEEKLRLEEEALLAVQREAARLAKLRKLKEGKPHAKRIKLRTEAESKEPRHKPSSRESDGEFDVYLQNVKAQSEAYRTNRPSSETNAVTPNTESSWDFTCKTDATSLDLEWEDEEGMNRMGHAWERSRTEEDILRAALHPGGKKLGSGPTSTSEDSNALEWENDFVSAHVEDECGDEDFKGFVHPLLDTPTEEAELKDSPEQQER